MNCIIAAWHNHEAELRGFLTRHLRDARLAEDLLQDTFVKALGQGIGFCTLENPRAWLFRVARNLLVDHRRHRKPFVDLDESIAHQEPEIPAVESLSACLPRALAALGVEDREAITLCDLEGLAQADFAHRKGLSLPGAKSRVQRARQRLKRQLSSACQVRFDEMGNVCCYTPHEPSFDERKD